MPSFKYQSFEALGPIIYTKNAGAMGKAWQTARIHEFPNRPAVFEALLNPKAFLENEVYTEQAPDGRAVCLTPTRRVLSGGGPTLHDRLGAFLAGFQGSPTIIKDNRSSPCQVQFGVRAAHQGFLVFDESFSPGWHAWVDGEPKPIFRAYGLWMSVLLANEGAHQVLFSYEPNSFRLGLFVTLLSLTLFLVVLCRKWLLLD